MLAVLTQAFLLGLATAPFCAVACAPVFLPVVLAGEETRKALKALALGKFLLGRLIAYAAVGLLLGWLGQAAAGISLYPVGIAANAFIGLALLLYAAAETGRQSSFCRVVRAWTRAGRLPFLLGLLTGVNICPPFVAAMSKALLLSGPVQGLVFFLAFFAATSLVTLPMLLVSFAAWVPAVRSVGRAACGLCGMIFLCVAAQSSGLHVLGRTYVFVSGVRGAALRQLLPQASEFREESAPVRHFRALAAGQEVGVVAFSTDLAPEVRGFNGPVPVAVAINTEGTITGVRVLESRETPGYVRKIYAPEFARQFRDKSYSDLLTVGRDIHGVTGATVTARAVARGVRLTARRAADRVLGLQRAEPPPPASRARLNPWHLGILVFFVVAVLGEIGRVKWLRYIVLAAAFFYLGVWQRAFFSVRHLADIFCRDLPPVAVSPVWYILALPALLLALVMGRVYCAWICPFGAVTELLGRIFNSPLKVTPRWDRRLRHLKYFLLIILPVLYAVFESPGVLAVEPFSEVFALGFLTQTGDVTLGLAWLLFLAAASLLVFRFFCRYLCPAGAAMAFLARHRLWGRVRPDGCIECGECGVSCPKKGGRP